jgi:hypothetical protein
MTAAAAAGGFLVGARVGVGVACGALLGLALLQSQARIVGLCTASGLARWKRRLGFLWLLKYPVLLAGLYFLVTPPIGGLVISPPAFAVGLGLVPAALVVHAVTARRISGRS